MFDFNIELLKKAPICSAISHEKWCGRFPAEILKAHRGRIMQKIGVSSVAELVRLTQLVDIEPVE